jgi:Ca2+/Na+ antiporter
MTLNAYLQGVRVSTAIAFFAWAAVVLYIDPTEAGFFGNGLFYMTLFLWLSGGITLLLVWLRRKWQEEHQIAGSLGTSLRQSAFLALYILTLLTFQYFQILTWWDALLAGVAVLLIELYFLHQSGRFQVSSSSAQKK